MSRTALDHELASIIEQISDTATDIGSKISADFDTVDLPENWATQLETDLYDLDAKSVELLWREQPFARDLRLLMALINASAHLRRVTWLANHLILNWANLSTSVAPPKVRELLMQLKSMTAQHYDYALGAFLSGDVDWAASVEQSERKIDALCAQTRIDIAQIWSGRHDAEQVESIMSSGLFVRFAERIGDHATAISRHVATIQSSAAETKTDADPHDLEPTIEQRDNN